MNNNDIEAQNEQKTVVTTVECFYNLFIDFIRGLALMACIASGVWCFIEVLPMYKTHNIHMLIPILIDIHIVGLTIIPVIGFINIIMCIMKYCVKMYDNYI